MKAALVVNKIGKDTDENLKNVIAHINKAADENADLVLFSETALTGLVNDDNPEADILLGIQIPGEIINKVCEVAKSRSINVVIGVFERENKCLYDSAIFINREGQIGLKYRRMSKGWHDPRIKDSIYKEGNEIKTYNSDIGKVAILICGDLFDDELAKKVNKLNTDYLLFPFARSFYDGTINQEKWQKEELPDYINQIKKTGTIALGTNYLCEEYFGGAFIISEDGQLLKSFELGKEGMLISEI